jgi:hypothetical protein
MYTCVRPRTSGLSDTAGELTLITACSNRAHKAAHPERYPIPPHVIKLMPHLKDINERFEPTQVHLQVYDGQSLCIWPCSWLPLT